MFPHHFRFARIMQWTTTAFLAAAALLPASLAAQSSVPQSAAHPHTPAVLVELFTSEGCSDCPPADDLLRQVSGQRSAAGQLVVGISEHVTYWNRLGWSDPFSSDRYTERQNQYSTRFALDSVYTPQMVVNGHQQFVGSNRRALEAALAAEAKRPQILLQIDSAQIAKGGVSFTYTAANLPSTGVLQLVAVLVDDLDRSSVLRGENSGRELTHVAVARALAPLGVLRAGSHTQVTLPLPPSFASGAGHHLVLFAQQDQQGAVVGTDSSPI